MDRIVSNTGPLIALAGIERLDILSTLFSDVLIPVPVHQEVLQGYSGAVTISGKSGDDAKLYQEKQVKQAIEEITS